MKIIKHKIAQQILSDGILIDSWPCDVNSEGETELNGGEEFVILHKEKYYRFVGSGKQVFKNVPLQQMQVGFYDLPEWTREKIEKEKLNNKQQSVTSKKNKP